MTPLDFCFVNNINFGVLYELKLGGSEKENFMVTSFFSLSQKGIFKSFEKCESDQKVRRFFKRKISLFRLLGVVGRKESQSQIGNWPE